MFGMTAHTASAKQLVLVILDTTGSMTGGSIPPFTRMEVAKRRINSFLASTFDPDTEIALWFFSGTGHRVIRDFAVGAAAKSAIIASVTAATPSGDTPLAHTVCLGVDAIVNRGIATLADTLQIYLASDGEENNTDPSDQCFGPGSSDANPPFTMGSWQNKVYNKVCSGDPSSPGACGISHGFSYVIDVDQLFGFVPPSLSSGLPNLEPGRHTKDLFPSLAPPRSLDEVLFFTLAQVTGGTYTAITPQTPLSVVFPVPGDANRDGCVNTLDRSQVLQDFGTRGNGFDDFNHDGVVNTLDLQTVLQHFGQCNVPPV
jgi:hypothetical protein